MNMPTEALILAGGLGTRLRAVVSDVPKPMAPVGGEPFLAHVARYWIAQGITRLVFSIGYKGECIRAYFGDRYEGASVAYSVEESPLGTGGAVRHALDTGDWQQDALLLLNGNTMVRADLAQLAQDAPADAPITLTLTTVEDNYRYGGVVLDDHRRVARFETASGGRTRINTGCYLLRRTALATRLASYPPRFSFEEEVLRPLAGTGLLGASIQEKPFLDIGIPEDYERAASFLAATTE